MRRVPCERSWRYPDQRQEADDGMWRQPAGLNTLDASFSAHGGPRWPNPDAMIHALAAAATSTKSVVLLRRKQPNAKSLPRSKLGAPKAPLRIACTFKKPEPPWWRASLPRTTRRTN